MCAWGHTQIYLSSHPHFIQWWGERRGEQTMQDEIKCPASGRHHRNYQLAGVIKKHWNRSNKQRPLHYDQNGIYTIIHPTPVNLQNFLLASSLIVTVFFLFKATDYRFRVAKSWRMIMKGHQMWKMFHNIFLQFFFYTKPIRTRGGCLSLESETQRHNWAFNADCSWSCLQWWHWQRCPYRSYTVYAKQQHFGMLFHAVTAVCGGLGGGVLSSSTLVFTRCPKQSVIKLSCCTQFCVSALLSQCGFALNLPTETHLHSRIDSG